MSSLEVVLLLVAVLVGMSVQAAIGFGFALFVAPAAFAVFEPEQAVTLVLILAIAINLLVLLTEGRRTEVARRDATLILTGTIPGLIAGAWLLARADHQVLQLLVGVVVVAGAALQAFSFRARERRRRPQSRPRTLELCGGVAIGALTTSVSVNGPVLVLLLTRLGLRGGALRDTLAAVLLGVSVLAAPVLLIGAGSDALPDGWLTLACFPVLVLGHRVGAAIFRRLDADSHRALVLGAAAVAGLLSIGAAVLG